MASLGKEYRSRSDKDMKDSGRRPRPRSPVRARHPSIRTEYQPQDLALALQGLLLPPKLRAHEGIGAPHAAPYRSQNTGA
jgi:hypothetical protein